MRASMAPGVVVAVLLAVAPAGAQQRDTVGFPPARADALSGLYVLEDGRLVHVTDLRDQMGEPALSATEFASGRARALFPKKDGWFDAGNAWFRWDSIQYRVRFDETEHPVRALTWEEGGSTLSGTRAPLVEREVSIRSGDVVLAGTLVLPPGPGPHPALVMVPGSGPETRRIPRQVGDLLAYNGIAVLVTDKRGTGGSTGEWNGLSHADWAGDVEAHLDFLGAQPEIDASRIGLWGNSEGGYVVPVVAARRPDVRFLVCRVCAALPQSEVVPDIERGTRQRRGMPEFEVAAAVEMVERMIRYALTRTAYDSLAAHFESGAERPWRASFPVRQLPAADARYWDVYRENLVVDPRDHYARLRIPTLVVLGEADDRLLIGRRRAEYERLAESGVDLTLWVIPEASHGLMLGPGNALGYPPGLHERLMAWVKERAGVR
ncbi:MAG TPA: alpha/beta fold hydrolase [Longimicrobiales bacterium]|nr:alpha/beta fold hydrolase [Longimicrobiales bacterium]